jgi:hypothetical protein
MAAQPPLPFPPGVPPPTMRMGAPPPRSSSSLPPSNVVLLKGVPEFLHPCLSSWILPCGPARTILWYPKQLDFEEKLASKKKSMALVTMMHGDGAWKLVHTVRALNLSTKTTFQFDAYMVPASPDIPLPPIELPAEVATPLQEMMKKTFDEFETNGGKLTTSSSTAPPPPPLSLDTQKVAAAAGGHNYDEDADPLNAPAVLQAVKDFRKLLEKSSTVQQARRVQLVQTKLEEAMQARIKNGGLAPPPPAAANNLPPPPLPTGVPPLGGLPPPPLPADVDSGKRGQSNLPAWMTTAPPATEPPAKKQKTLDPATLRDFVAHQIKSLMGEEEATLIDFIVKHVTEEKPMVGLIEELQPVLEEDTNKFVEALQAKMKEL